MIFRDFASYQKFNCYAGIWIIGYDEIWSIQAIDYLI